jgi:hypothetical protein
MKMKNLLSLLLLLTFTATVTFAQNEDIPFDDLPPAPEDGKCYAKCKMPDRYETVTIQKLKKAGKTTVSAAKPQYRTETETIVIKEASVKYINVPAVYETVEKQILVKEGYCTRKVIPAQYSYESTNKTLVQPEGGRWVRKKKDPNCLSANPEDCFVMCWEVTPAQYSYDTQKTLVSSESEDVTEIPATYTTLKVRVVKTPATTRTVNIPEVTKTITKKVRVNTECLGDVINSTPDQYTTVTEKRLVSTGGYTEWVEILCAANTSDAVVRQVQTALKDKGYSVGSADGVMGIKTRSMLIQYQKDNGLPQGNLNIETLKSLGVNAN